MKKFVAIVAISSGLGMSSMGAVRDNCGCGLGTMLLGDQDETLVVQMAATFLNGFLGNQTFGITTGTLGCEKFTDVAQNERVLEYVTDNMDHLAMDMALGYGQSLDALADLMEVSKDARSGFYTKLQQNFGTIYSSEEVTASQVVVGISQLTQS